MAAKRAGKGADEIIGATFGMEIGEMREARYQMTRTPIPVYAIGDSYYCCPPKWGNCPPKGWKWEAVKDQFFAKPEGRVIYVAGNEPEDE